MYKALSPFSNDKHFTLTRLSIYVLARVARILFGSKRKTIFGDVARLLENHQHTYTFGRVKNVDFRDLLKLLASLRKILVYSKSYERISNRM